MYSRSERGRVKEKLRRSVLNSCQGSLELSRLTLQATELWQNSSSVQICGAFFSQANLFEILLLKTDAVSICVEGLKVTSGLREST